MNREVTFRRYRKEKGFISRTVECEKYLIPSEEHEGALEEVYIPAGDADGIRTLMTNGASYNGTETVTLKIPVDDFYKAAKAYVK